MCVCVCARACMCVGARVWAPVCALVVSVRCVPRRTCRPPVCVSLPPVEALLYAPCCSAGGREHTRAHSQRGETSIVNKMGILPTGGLRWMSTYNSTSPSSSGLQRLITRRRFHDGCRNDFTRPSASQGEAMNAKRRMPPIRPEKGVLMTSNGRHKIVYHYFDKIFRWMTHP